MRTTEEYPYYVGQPFGDTVSHRTINTTGPTAFDEPMLLIHTADWAAAEAVKEAYTASGIEGGAVSVRQVDSETVRLWDRSNGKSWHESKPDILSMIGRMTIPDPDPENMVKYSKYEKQIWPAKFYFAYDDVQAKVPTVPSLKSRDTDTLLNETEVYSASMQALHAAVVEEYRNYRGAKYMGTQDVNFTSLGFYDDWDDIVSLKDNSSFVLDTRDALYGSPIASSVHFIPEGTGAVVIGVNHKRTLGAAYNSVGVSVMDPTTFKYIESHWFIDVDLEGSAERYLPKDPKAADLFAIDFMPPGMCSPTAKWCIEFNKTSYDNSLAKFILGERIYCLQDTMIGPPANRTISTRLPIFMF